MKRYFLIALALLLNCSDDGWNSDRKKDLKDECIENASQQVLSEYELLDICSCITKQFINDFSWDEYQKMLNIRITDENNLELSSKLQTYISSVMEECNISL